MRRADLADYIRRRRQPPVVTGYDVTATTEKSVSVLALLASRHTGRQILDTIEAANDQALIWLEDHAAETRIQGQTVKGDGWTAASFRHLTSRALDPFVHHHNVIANTVVGPDGRRRALDARQLHTRAKAASALATAQMRYGLTHRLGVRWRTARHGGWEIDGISDEVIRAFSQRRSDIDEVLDEWTETLGRDARPSEVDQIARSTRPAKQNADVNDLRSQWWQRAYAHGLNDLRGCTGRSGPIQTPDPEVLHRLLAERICTNVSVFSYDDVLSELVNLPIPQPDGTEQPLVVSADELEERAHQFLASEHVAEIAPHRDIHLRTFTVVETQETQDRIVARYRQGRNTNAGIVEPATLADVLDTNPHLTAEQIDLVTRFCTSGQRVQCAIGRAGAGKTTAMRTAAHAWQQAGFRVVGAAVKGEAARILADGAGIATETLAWWLAHDNPNTLPFDARTVIIVDEASTISDRDLDQLCWLAEQTGATLRLIGDPAQHSSVEAGGMFRVLCEHHPDDTPALTRNLRLRNPHDRAAADALRSGQIDTALDHLQLAGHLHVIENEADALRHMLTQWWQAHRDGLDHPMVDRRNTIRRRLNQAAHQILQAHGDIGTDELPRTTGSGFSIGDRVIAKAPARHLHPEGDPRAYVRNGATGTVLDLRRGADADQDQITVEFDHLGIIRLPRAYFDNPEGADENQPIGLDHAYAVTSYAVQGATHTTSTSRIDPRSRRSEAYVDITRGTDSNHLYITPTHDNDGDLDDEELPRLPDFSPDHAVAHRLRRSKGERTAWEIRRAHQHHQHHDNETPSL